VRAATQWSCAPSGKPSEGGGGGGAGGGAGLTGAWSMEYGVRKSSPPPGGRIAKC
jgi:hypothetical protein